MLHRPVLTLALLQLYLLSFTVGESCKPGETWEVECNRCFCSETGVAVCTRKGCLTPREKRTADLGGVDGARNRCSPGARWKEDCNSCFCTEDGLAACTKKGCVPHLVNLPQRVQRDLQGEEAVGAGCTPGARWKEDCNTCVCNDFGRAACTKKGCKPHIVNVRAEREAQGSGCTPGTMWKRACNTCICDLDGYSTCTSNRCK